MGKANQVGLQFMFYVGEEFFKSALTGIDLRGPFKSGRYCRGHPEKQLNCPRKGIKREVKKNLNGFDS